MIEKFALPIIEDKMPMDVRLYKDDAAMGMLISLDRFGLGTPDGECETEQWILIFYNVNADSFQIINLFYTDSRENPVVEIISLSKYYQMAFRNLFKDGRIFLSERVPIDVEMMNRMYSLVPPKEVA